MKPERKIDPALEAESVASATGQTGLMPALPEDEAEAAYEALCPIPRPKENTRGKR